MQAAIQASSGSFTNVWQMADGFGFGVSSYHGGDEKSLTSAGFPNYLNRDDLEMAIESQVSFSDSLRSSRCACKLTRLSCHFSCRARYYPLWNTTA